MTKTYQIITLTAIVAASCSLPIEGEREQEEFEQDTSEQEILRSGEGPWTGGVFKQRPSVSANTGRTSAPQTSSAALPLIADNGETNEVIVMLERDEAALRRAVGIHLPFTVGMRPEDALIEAVRRLEPRTLDRFSDPLGIRYLITQQRPSESRRREILSNSPEDRLYRYVVLEFDSVEDAQHAADSLAKTPGVEYASLGQALSFSATPNDPYFPIKPTAAHYQWGIHAMAFPTAWDLTPGNAWLGAADAGFVMHADLQNVRSQLSFETTQLPDVYKIHGMHVSGIMAATQSNAAGVSGGCPSCSVMMATCAPLSVGVPEAIRGLVDRGAQVINMSFGQNGVTCSSSGMQPICDAIAYAQSRDVLLVAAAGNYNQSTPDFPSNQSAVLAVGGIQNSSPTQPWQWQSWFYNSANGSTAAGVNGVVAPAKSIVSTMPAYGAYNSNPWVKCGDAVNYDESGTVGDGYGSCTGTSMAAPHITALSGMIRSINPRLSAETVKDIIRQNGSHAAMRNNQVGYGLPNASSSVTQAIGLTTNRLTPLFAFYSAGRLDYFYTTVPQMAAAAINGTLQPGVGTSPPGYSTIGGSIVAYSNFPGISATAGRIPAAEVWIFTTPTNPQSQTIPLAPLYRLSWKCGDAGNSPACANTPSHTDFVYTADSDGVAAYISVGYQLDGIEGYIYPKTIPQPSGTVRLMRKYNPVRDDHAIFPESQLANMQAQGYTLNSGSDWLGYVYPNLNGTVPPVQGGSNGASFSSQSVPTLLVPGQVAPVSVTMCNTGGTTWTAAGAYRLGSQSPQDNFTWGTNRITLSASDNIAPGQCKQFAFNITAPATPGTYNFQWRMVQDGVEWFGAASSTVQIQVVSAASNNASFSSQSVPTVLQPGQVAPVSVTMCNTGGTTWTAASSYRLGSQSPQDNLTWGTGRIHLSATDSIAPGQCKQFTFNITAPSAPGTYNFQWRMVRELVAWFGAYSPLVQIQVRNS